MQIRVASTSEQARRRATAASVTGSTTLQVIFFSFRARELFVRCVTVGECFIVGQCELVHREIKLDKQNVIVSEVSGKRSENSQMHLIAFSFPGVVCVTH